MKDTIEINGKKYIAADSIPEQMELGDLVIVRTYSAGVHIGNFNIENWKDSTQTIRLTNARRLWRWRGANTLNEVAKLGVNRSEYTRISTIVMSVIIHPIEIIPVVSGLDFSEVWNA